MKKLYILILLLAISVTTFGQTVGDYRSNPTLDTGGDFYT